MHTKQPTVAAAKVAMHGVMLQTLSDSLKTHVIINRHLRNRFSRSEVVMLDSSAEESPNDQKKSLKREGQSKQDMTRVMRQRSSPLSDNGISQGTLAQCRHHTSAYSSLVAFGEKQGKPQGRIDQF
jgi:hypothetical protein